MDLVFGNSADPGKILGRHFVGHGQVITAFHPDAVSMQLCLENGEELEMDRVERQPLYSIYYPSTKNIPYKIRMTFRDGNELLARDPYSFDRVISLQEEAWFLDGIWTDSYKKMGAHTMTVEGVEGTYFSVWAPLARRVSIIADFNFWNGMLCPMNRLGDSGIFELFIPGITGDFQYKYEIKKSDGSVVQKADPYGRMNLRKQGGNTRHVNEGAYQWKDFSWMQNRKERFGSLKYVNIADYSRDRLEPGILQEDLQAYTHVLVSGSTQAQTSYSWTESGVYSLPVENCTPNQIKEMVDLMHGKNLGVIIKCDFGYFHDDPSGLSQFDGHSLYGFSDARKHYNDEKQEFRFSYSKDEVKGYLYSAIKMWMDEYHIDGFMLENQSEILFPDWELEASYRKCSMSFFNQVYRLIKSYDSGVLVIGDALNSGHFQDEIVYSSDIVDCYEDNRVHEAVKEYLQADREKRKSTFYKLVRPFLRRGVEMSLTALNGLYKENLTDDQANMASAFLLGIPGYKQRVMQAADSAQKKAFLQQLVQLTKEEEALQFSDYGLNCFEWIDGTNVISETISFIRKSKSGRNLLFVCNFGESARENHYAGIPENVPYTLIADSSMDEKLSEQKTYLPINRNADLRNHSIVMNLKPYHTLVFAYQSKL